MSYFNGAIDPDDLDGEYIEDRPSRSSKAKLNAGIFILICGVVASTFAANISLGGSRKEFGQGIFQIKACDQWVGIGLTTGQGSQNSYVANVRVIGLNPRACRNTLLRIKFFTQNATLPTNMYYGAGNTPALSDSVTATSLVLRVTNTAYSGSNYAAWANDAVTLIDPQGRDAGYADDYEIIEYVPETGVYSVILTYPTAVATDVKNITIETAKYS
jgi:hypothetical protein